MLVHNSYKDSRVWYGVDELFAMMRQSAFDRSKFGWGELNLLTPDKSTSVRWFRVDELTTGIASGREEAGRSYG